MRRSDQAGFATSQPSSRRRGAHSSVGRSRRVSPRAAFIGPGASRARRQISKAQSSLGTATFSKRWDTGCMTSPPDLASLNTRGTWPPPEGPRVAIVGSRRPSPYGEAVAEQLAADLARAGVVVVSGLALGCDAAAHRGALVGGGVTVAVMGTGVDIVYPAAHARLAEEILAAGGALVSQFPNGTEPRRRHFPARNLTMAALSDAVVVVEAMQ